MQFIVITSPNILRIQKALSLKSGIELRLDLFNEIDLNEINTLRKKCINSKIIFTLRSKNQGGGYTKSPHEHQTMIYELLEMQPDYFDIEWDMPLSFFERIQEEYPETKIICSYHDYLNTPKFLESQLKKMERANTYAYKLCTTATKPEDSYRMLKFIQNQSKKGLRIIGICMGEIGIVTREEGLAAGNYLNYKILHSMDRVAGGLCLI